MGNKKGFSAEITRITLFLFPILMVFMFDMQARYWSLNDEIVPFEQLNKESGILVVVAKQQNTKGLLGTQISIIDEDNNVLCCYRIVNRAISGLFEGKAVDVYWQGSKNIIADYFDQRYVLHIDVYNSEGRIYRSPINYRSSSIDLQDEYLESIFPFGFWYFISAVLFAYFYIRNKQC